jgi:hypothetical protein
VATTQAGQEMTCAECQERFEVPQLQVLRQLDTEESWTKPDPLRRTSGRREVLFVIGLVTMLLGMGTGYELNRHSNSLMIEFESPETQVEEQANALSPAQVLGQWVAIENSADLPEWQEHPMIGNLKQGRILKNISFGLWGIGGLGFLMIIASFFCQSKKRKLNESVAANPMR